MQAVVKYLDLLEMTSLFECVSALLMEPMEDLSFDDIITSLDPYLSSWRRRFRQLNLPGAVRQIGTACDYFYSGIMFKHQDNTFNNMGGIFDKYQSHITYFNL